MDHAQIETALNKLYNENNRLVFWNDPEKEFIHTLPFISLPNVKVIHLDKESALKTKILIEKEEPEGRFLLYSPTEEPAFEEDWLLDLRLYSKSFRADRASILLQELGLKHQYLRQHLTNRRKFFDNKERVQKLKSFIAPDDTEDDLDRKMLAVLVKTDQPEQLNIIRTLFHAYLESAEQMVLDNPPLVWEQIEKLDLAEFFWQMVKTSFGYSEEHPCLRNLLLRLLVTDFAFRFKAELPRQLQHLLLPRDHRPNVIVCLAQWRDSRSMGGSYDKLATEAAALLKIRDCLALLEIEPLIDVMTFAEVEQHMVSCLRDRVQSTQHTINAEDIRSIATRRQAGYWASSTISHDPQGQRRAYAAMYDALVAAADFFALQNKYQAGFHFDDASAMYRAYETELYRFDQLYRKFCESADLSEAQGWGVLKPLREQIEAGYVNGYLMPLSLGWGKFIEPQRGASLLLKWKIEEVPSQQQFFDTLVRPRLEEADNRKVYVVISDAFRYEAAHELTQKLNGHYRFRAELSSQLGVLPSYTTLGMAGLLPHKTLQYKINGEMLVDNKPMASFVQRDAILQTIGGMACKPCDLMGKKKEEGRAFVNGKRVIYIYHDAIDAIGGSSEKDTFAGVRKGIEELTALVSYIINNLGGTHIIVTADHGFLFTETAPGETCKSKLPEKPSGTIRSNRRYLLGHNLPEHESIWHGSTSITAQADGDMEFWIPKGPNRFHFAGGSLFIHGGAMLQEIVIPVITVKQIKGKSAEYTRIKSVLVQVLGNSPHRITTPKHRFEFIQMEPVTERVKALTLKVAVYEGDEPITNIEQVTFDSASSNMDERKKSIYLVLRDHQYTKKTTGHLVLRDADTGIELQRVEVIIDRAFADDF